MFEVTVRTSFEATHALRGYRGADETPHAHRFVCEVAIASAELGGSGCAVDFVEVDRALARAIAPLAGKSLGESPLFARESPSAENIARALHRALAESLDDDTRRIARVTIWEDDHHGASFYA